MGVKSITVLLEPDYDVYFGGQTIMGTVRVEVSSEVSCRAVEVTCSGKSDVHWSEKHNDETRNYDAKEKYMKLSKNAWTPESRNNQKLPAGNYSWPFSFQLPQDLPSSFEGTVGFIRYKIKAKVDIPMAFDSKDSKYFSVCCPVDLNYDQNAKKPLKILTSDTSCCCCCEKGPVALDFCCQYSGAVIGEKYKIRGEVANQGSKEAENSEVTLYQKVKYFAKGHKKSSNNKVCSLKRGAIKPGDSDYYEDVLLKIPAVVPSLKFCRIMELEYSLVFEANFGSCSSVSDKAQFYVGTVPFMPEGAASNMPFAAAPPAFAAAPPAFAAAPAFPSAPLPDGGMGAPPVGFVPVGAVTMGDPGMPPPMGVPGMPPAMGAPGMPPPMGAPGMPPYMGASGYPPPAPALEPFNTHPMPGSEECHFCHEKRSRRNSKNPPPKYISYSSVM